MDVSRREFIGMVSATAAAAGLACGDNPGTEEAVHAPPGDDPLNIRKDFPVVYNSV